MLLLYLHAALSDCLQRGLRSYAVHSMHCILWAGWSSNCSGTHSSVDASTCIRILSACGTSHSPRLRVQATAWQCAMQHTTLECCCFFTTFAYNNTVNFILLSVAAVQCHCSATLYHVVLHISDEVVYLYLPGRDKAKEFMNGSFAACRIHELVRQNFVYQAVHGRCRLGIERVSLVRAGS